MADEMFMEQGGRLVAVLRPLGLHDLLRLVEIADGAKDHRVRLCALHLLERELDPQPLISNREVA